MVSKRVRVVLGLCGIKVDYILNGWCKKKSRENLGGWMLRENMVSMRKVYMCL